jgi:hypothetical protein
MPAPHSCWRSWFICCEVHGDEEAIYIIVWPRGICGFPHTSIRRETVYVVCACVNLKCSSQFQDGRSELFSVQIWSARLPAQCDKRTNAAGLWSFPSHPLNAEIGNAQNSIFWPCPLQIAADLRQHSRSSFRIPCDSWPYFTASRLWYSCIPAQALCSILLVLRTFMSWCLSRGRASLKFTIWTAHCEKWLQMDWLCMTPFVNIKRSLLKCCFFSGRGRYCNLCQLWESVIFNELKKTRKLLKCENAENSTYLWGRVATCFLAFRVSITNLKNACDLTPN